jgi:hypothetical protein
MHPETKRGAAANAHRAGKPKSQNETLAPAFIDDAAKKTGKGRSTVALSEAGESQRAIATKVRVSQSVISEVLNDRKRPVAEPDHPTETDADADEPRRMERRGRASAPTNILGISQEVHVARIVGKDRKTIPLSH